MKACFVFTIFYAALASALAVPKAANKIHVGTVTESVKNVISKTRDVVVSTKNDNGTTENDNIFHKRAKEGEYECNVGSDGAGDQNALIDGINYLNDKWPDAVWPVEPGTCNRATCSWNSAIWVCSDADHSIQPKTKDIVALASVLINNCIENTFFAIWTEGRIYANEEWNVILGKDSC
ncbi:hypothetical protein B0J13DRAFT_107632 [Dactylonectria estremocensis]|uniref:Ecp2 effector protein domain-containing protein n=1 Tax=Dactylonectria estremocensis TaxID=1079267 RepID=A0A9P9ITB8_9HYPO|nr:hypothetical protein B0J13DRAFT_107632 [Dactylonectria estremocensis]